MTLQSRELLAHQVIDRLASPVVIVAKNGTIAYWNPAAEQTFGYRASEAEGRTLEALLVAPDGNGGQLDALTEAARSGSAAFAAECRTRSGKAIPLTLAVDAIADRPGGTPAYFMLIPRPAGTVHAPAVAPRPDQGSDGLTVRQREVLELIAEGWSTRQIAQKLKLSVKTVETHRAHLMQRLRVDSVAKLVRYAVAVGLVPPTP